MQSVVARWWCLVTSGVALVMLHWAMQPVMELYWTFLTNPVQKGPWPRPPLSPRPPLPLCSHGHHWYPYYYSNLQRDQSLVKFIKAQLLFFWSRNVPIPTTIKSLFTLSGDFLQLAHKKSRTFGTAVSKSDCFSPIGGDYSLKVGNYLLLFFALEAK